MGAVRSRNGLHGANGTRRRLHHIPRPGAVSTHARISTNVHGALDSAGARDHPERTIGAAESEELLRPLCGGEPVHADGLGVDVHHFAFLILSELVCTYRFAGDVPLPNGVVVSDTEQLVAIRPAAARNQLGVFGPVASF